MLPSSSDLAAMCRFTLYLGPPVRLSTLITDPEHSLLRQSYQSVERSEPLNGDGFGIGWYAPRIWHEPALFHQITPAWSNRSLRTIAKVVCSPCIMAHVRAATPGSDVNLANCHPFGYGGYLLMHNGHVGGFRKIRRRLLESLSDEAFDLPRGSTDTEHLFAVFVDELLRHGCPVDPGAEGTGGLGALELARRLSAAITRVLQLSAEFGGGESSFLNVAVADGSHVAVCRFDSDPEEQPESLYHFHGELYEPAGRGFPERREGDDGEAMVVSSERLTGDPRWMAVPPASMLVLDRHAPSRVLPMDDLGRLIDA